MSTHAGRNWAYTGAVLGGLVSIAANIAHSYVPPIGALADWSPKVGAVIGAVFWPVFLFVAVEILARVAWPRGLGWQALRFGGIAPVAFVAALVSYRHLSGLLAFYGEEPIVCVLGPLAVDGLMVMATGAILATGHQPTTLPVTAVPDPIRAPAPTLPAVPAPRAATPAGDISTTPNPEPATLPDRVPAKVEVPTPKAVAARVTGSPTSIPLRSDTTPAGTPTGPKPRPRPTRPATPAPPLAAPAADSSVTAPEPAQLPLPYVVDPGLLDRARQAVTAYQTEHGARITAGQLAARLRINSEQAAQALAVLNLDPTTSDISSTVNGRRPAGTSSR